MNTKPHSSSSGQTFPRIHGTGIGLRSQHYRDILETKPRLPWFEAVSENFMGLRSEHGSPAEMKGGGRPLEVLDKIRMDYPVVLHGVSMNVGSVDPLDRDYLIRLKTLAKRIEPVYVSDHLCWTGMSRQNLHDLLPLPFTRESVRHVSARVRTIQDFLGRRILLENVSTYLTFQQSEMTEWEFLTLIAGEADCGILLDVNNIYVSAVNHGFDAREYLNGVPKERVLQMHLAGYSEEGDLLIDTHDHPVTRPVWDLYRDALKIFGPVPTLIEWDEKIPPLSTLLSQARRAEKIKDDLYARKTPVSVG